MESKLIQLVNSYIENATIHGEATLEGDYKAGNKAMKKISKIFAMMEQDNNFALELLKIAMSNPNTNVRILSSAHALGLNIYTNEAVHILEEIQQADSSILGFNAKMALKNFGLTQ